MKYTARQYAQSLLELSQKATPEAISNAVTSLELMLIRQGKRSLMKQIAKELSSAQDKEKGIVQVVLTLPTRASGYAKDIVESLSNISNTAVQVETKYDDTIIAGSKVLVDSQWYIDATMNQRLQRLSDQLHK